MIKFSISIRGDKMYRLFKSTRIPLQIIVIVGIISAVIFLIRQDQIDSMWFYCIFILEILASFILILLIVEKIANAKFNKINRLRSDKLAFQEYIDAYIQLLTNIETHQASKKLRDIQKSYVLCNLSAGYMDLGDEETAYQALTQIDDFPDNASGALLKFVYFNNLFVYYSRKENIEEMTIALDNMEEALKAKKISKATRAKYQYFLMSAKFILNIQNGNFEGSEEFFEASLSEAGTLLANVAQNGTLGKIYIHNKKFDKAKEALNFTIANSKDSYYGITAKELLDQIS